ncbi:ATP-binding cassette domain-containing protein [Microbacterium sp. RD1]|uniref:ATP-binding cassette domain-containing protein n=1 Tax=Microbacterium sp. RD1 TaxID=3457313 RepID=UPI003FA5F0F8
MRRRTEPDVAVRADDLSLSRGGVRVVDGVSLTLTHRTVLAIMGPTGSGKSTLAAFLAGQEEDGLHAVGGSALVHGIDARHPGRSRRQWTYATGYVPQRAGADLPSRLTVADVIGEPITSRDRRVNPRALAVRVATLLDEMQLPLGAAAKYPYELSAGMRQRVALARALVLDPRLLVADDPYANLDVEVRGAAREAIMRRRDGYGMTTLLVTNDGDAARELDADVLVLRSGHPVAYGHSGDALLWTPDGADAPRAGAR